MNAPERIWATVAGIQPLGRSHGIWDQSDERTAQGHWYEYTRADLVEARIYASQKPRHSRSPTGHRRRCGHAAIHHPRPAWRTG